MSKKPAAQGTEPGYRNGVAKRQITVRIKGSDATGGYPRLSDFLKQLDTIKVALKHAERLHAHSENAVDYRIVSLSMASPATVVLEEIPKAERLPRVAVSQKLISDLRQIESGRKIPAMMHDLAALEAYRNVGTILRGDGLSISGDGKEVTINEGFKENIQKIIGPDQILEGSLTGRLLAINLHNTTKFEIYPPVGPQKVACDFPGADKALKHRVIAGIDHNVRVVGSLRYKHWAPYPHAINAHDIEVFPPNDQLPTLDSLYGVGSREQRPLNG